MLKTTAISRHDFFDVGRIASALPEINRHILYGIAIGMRENAELVQNHKAEQLPMSVQHNKT